MCCGSLSDCTKEKFSASFTAVHNALVVDLNLLLVPKQQKLCMGALSAVLLTVPVQDGE